MNNTSETNDMKILKGGSVLDNVSYLRRYINSSDRAFIFKDFTDTQLGVRTIQRYLIWLANEGMIDFRIQPREPNKIGSNLYEFAKMGYWDKK